MEKEALFFLDNLLILYTHLVTLNWNPNNKRNFNKFYLERKLVGAHYIFFRVYYTYISFKLIK